MDSQTLTGHHKVPEGQEYTTPKKIRVCTIKAIQSFNIRAKLRKNKLFLHFCNTTKNLPLRKLSTTVISQITLHHYLNFFHCTLPCQHLLSSWTCCSPCLAQAPLPCVVNTGVKVGADSDDAQQWQQTWQTAGSRRRVWACRTPFASPNH